MVSAAAQDSPAPQFLFKYMRREVGTIVLRDRTLRWSTPGTLNDPYDMQFDLQVDVDKPAVKVAALSKLWEACYGGQPGLTGNHLGRVIEMLRRQFPQLTKEQFNRELGNIIDQTYDEMERLLPDLQADLRSHLAKCKILCLATVPNSLLMWYCYAEKCSGIALRFKCVPELDSPWPTALPINYLANMSRFVNNEFLADMLSGRVSLDHKSILHKMVYEVDCMGLRARMADIFR